MVVILCGLVQKIVLGVAPALHVIIIIIIFIYNIILLYIKMLEIITVTTACVVPLSMSQQLTTPRRLNVSLVGLPLILFLSSKHPLTMLTIQYIFKGEI